MGEGELSFGPFTVDANTFALRRDEELLSISRRAVALLIALLRAGGATVSKEVLLDAAWPGVTVEEANLTVQMAALRKALGPREDGQDWIVTVPRLGYRLLSPARRIASEERLPTFAVLPFENLSGDPDEDYFADGIVDELIIALSRFRGFAVIARSSSFAYKGRATDARATAHDLGVQYLVQGSVRRGGDRLRLATSLVDGHEGATLWAQSFEGPMNEVFAFQDRITAAVAGLVAPRIFSAEIARADHRRGGSLAAYDLRLRAIAALYRFTLLDNERAIGWLEAALQIEPESGPLKGLLCWALEMRFAFGWPLHRDDDHERCLALAHEAVQQTEDDAFVLVQCAVAMQLVGHDYDGGLRVAMRAVELNPNDVAVLAKASTAQHVGGDLAEAERLCRKVLAIHQHFEALGNMALVCCAKGEFAEAVQWASRAIAASPNFLTAYRALIVGYVNLGQLDEARKVVSTLLSVAPGYTTAKVATLRVKDQRLVEMFVPALRAAGLPD
jgi:TolB-like protein